MIIQKNIEEQISKSFMIFVDSNFFEKNFHQISSNFSIFSYKTKNVIYNIILYSRVSYRASKNSKNSLNFFDHLKVLLLITILISGQTDNKNRRMALRNLLLYYFHEIDFLEVLFIAPRYSTFGVEHFFFLEYGLKRTFFRI